MSFHVEGNCDKQSCKKELGGGSYVYCANCYMDLQDELKKAYKRIEILEAVAVMKQIKQGQEKGK